MTTLDYGTPIVGFVYRGKRRSAEDTYDLLFAENLAFTEHYFAEAYTTMTLSMVEVVIDWAEYSGIDVDLEDWDSDEFPFPLHAEDLGCVDIEWTELAPAHHMVPLSAPAHQRTCAWCGTDAP